MSDDFPTMVYRTPGQHHGPAGTTYDFLGINNASDLKAALAKGWHASLAEAAATKPAKEVIEIAEAKPRTRRKLKVSA